MISPKVINQHLRHSNLPCKPHLNSPWQEAYSSRSRSPSCYRLVHVNMTSSSSILPLLRAVAPRLSRRFFAGQQCTAKPAQIHSLAGSRSQYQGAKQSPFLKAFRSQSTTASPSPIANLGRNITSKVPKKKTASFASSFPDVSTKSVSYWLFGSAASVFGIVIFGGLTRLTESG